MWEIPFDWRRLVAVALFLVGAVPIGITWVNHDWQQVAALVKSLPGIMIVVPMLGGIFYWCWLES